VSPLLWAAARQSFTHARDIPDETATTAFATIGA
jgi:hypothetical protein